MAIVSSTYTEGAVQADGRRYVTEHYVDDAGQSYDYSWLGTEDAPTVVASRTTLLNAQLARAAAAQALVQGTLLPLTPLAFRDLLAPEQQAIDAFNATYTTNPALTSDQINAIRSGLENFRAAQNITRPFDSRVQAMLGLYVSLGLMTQTRMDAVMAAGNG